MAQNQKTVTVPIEMDSRKFLGAMNESAQVRIAQFEQRVADMGKQVGADWSLVALRSKDLFIEDRKTHQYYVAGHRREKGGRVVIEGIKPIRIVEGKKATIFFEDCLGLVKAIEENDQRGMQSSFNKMASHRFSSRVVPASGRVRTPDGRMRHINVSTGSLAESVRTALVSAVVEGLKDKVVVRDGVVVEGKFNDGQPVKLPVTKWSSHKLKARRMMEAASNAYWSKGFQKRVLKAASLVSESKLTEAIGIVKPFLQENEEFTLLNRQQTRRLVENTLAACGVFNQQLCNEVGLMLHRVNLKLHRDTILREWRLVAKRAQHPTLLDNVRILGESKNFESAYESFLRTIFEAISNREVTATSLATTLEVLRDRTPKIKESHDLASKLNDLIGRLKDKEFDDNAIYEAEDFIATVQEELANGDDLQNFDAMPDDGQGGGSPGDDVADLDLDEPSPPAAPQGQPQIVINAPLISLGGDGSISGPGADDLGLDDLDGEGEEPESPNQEQDDLLAAGQQAGQGGMGLESRGRRGRPLAEQWDEKKYGKAPWKKGEDDEDEGEDDEDDPYKFDDATSESIDADYGAPVLSDASDVTRVVDAMGKLAAEHKIAVSALTENMEDLALAGMEAVGIRVPHRKLNAAIEQVSRAFLENCDKDENGNGIEDCHESGHCDGCGNAMADCICDGPAEDQYKFGTTRRKGGFRRSSINQTERKGVKSESVNWLQIEEDGMLGEMAGVRFIFDHGGENPAATPVILSEDGAVQVPIPPQLYDSAFGAAKMMKADPAPFTQWLMEGPLDQVAPEGEDEAEAMDAELGNDEGSGEPEMGAVDAVEPDMGDDEFGGEFGDGDGDEFGDGLAMDEPGLDEPGLDEPGAGAEVTVKATGDGGIEVSIKSGDVDIDDGMGGDDDLGGEMQPVDSVVPPGDDEGDTEVPGDEMPDFEGGGVESEPDDEPADDFAEDEDFTQPKSSKYTAEVKGNPRKFPKVELPSDTDDELDGFDELKQGDKNGNSKGGD